MTKKYQHEWDNICPLNSTSTGKKKNKICPGTAPQSIKIGHDGEAQMITSVLSSIGINTGKIKVKRMHRMDSYSKEPIPHYVVPFASFKDMHNARNPLIKEGFNISELPQGKGKFFADKEMLTCQWIEIDDEFVHQFPMSHGESSRSPVEIAVSSKHITKADPTERVPGTTERVPLKPPPVKMCCMDIEAYSTRYNVDGSRAHPDISLRGDIINMMAMTFHNSGSVDIKAGTAEGIKKYCIFVIPPNVNRKTQETENLLNDIDASFNDSDDVEPVTDEPFQIEGVEMVFVNTEEELLIKYSEIMRFEDADVVYGYNVFGFDFDYISKRSKLYQIESYGRLASMSNEINQVKHEIDIPPIEQYDARSWVGAGDSYHSFTVPVSHGRIFLDTFNNTKQHKVDKSNPDALQSLKLGDVGVYFVGHTKRDVLFEINGVLYDSYAATYLGYRTGNVEMLKVIAKYCVQDTLVNMFVMDRMKGWESARESAITFYQDVNDVTLTGQTKHIKDGSLMLGESLDYVFHLTERIVKMKLEGGYVQNPITGKHDNVGCVDFSSMYPTTQMAYNICMSTFKKCLSVTDNPNDWICVRIPIQLDRIELPVQMEDFTGPDGEEFDINCIDIPEYVTDLFAYNKFNPIYKNEFVSSLKEQYGLIQARTSYYEVYFLKNTVRKGVFPLLLEQYRKARKEYKAMMNKSNDQVIKDIYNQKQNAVKVAMNSVYGISGSYRGMFSFLEGSAAITYLGRKAIKEVAAAFEADNCRIIYGDTDSVMIQAPGYINRGLTAPLDEESYRYFEEKTKWVNDVLLADRRPMEIELEKVMNAVFITKKRYGGKTIFPKEEPFFRGVSAVRGDMFPYGKQIYTTVFQMILEDKSIEDIEDRFEEMIEELETGQVPNDMLAVSKTLAHTYALPSAPMNVYAKYLHSIGEVAEPGTKIPLIITRPAGWSKNKQRALYYRLPNTTEPIDYMYYSNYIKNHVKQLVEAAFPMDE